MDSFVCLKETHDYGKILGICFNGQCQDVAAQFCLKCVMESHQDCKGDCLQFNQMNDIFQLIIENMEEQEIQIDREFEIVKKKYEMKKKEMMMKKQEFVLYQESNTSQEYVTLRSGIQNINEYEKLKSECLNFYLQKGYRLLKNKKWREASEQLNLSPKDQDYEVGQFFKSLALAQLNQFSENQKYIEKPECLKPSQVTYLQSYCDKLKQKGQEDTICQLVQGIILSFNKEYQKAIEIYDQVLAIDNSFMYSHYLKCVSLVKLKNFEQAKKIIIVMKKIDPNYYLTFIIEGYILYYSQQFEQALKCYNSAKSINQQYSSAHYYGGITLLQLDRNQEAMNYLQKATDLDNQDAKYIFFLGNALIRLQKKEEAIFNLIFIYFIFCIYRQCLFLKPFQDLFQCLQIIIISQIFCHKFYYSINKIFNYFFLMQNFVCLKESHQFSDIIAFCLNNKCTVGVPQCCLYCVLESHNGCGEDVKQFSEMKESLRLMIDKIIKQEDENEKEFQEKQIKYQTKKKELQVQKENLYKYQQSIDEQDYEIIKQGIPSLKVEYSSYKEEFQSFPLLKGLILLKNKKWQEAAAKFDSDNQDNEQEQFYKSWALAQQNKFSNTHKYIEQSECLTVTLITSLKTVCQQLQQRNQNDIISLITEGIILDNQKSYQQAIQKYEQVLQQDNQNQYCLYWKSLSLIKLNKLEEANQSINILRQLNENYYLLYIVQGYLLFKQEKYSEALVQYQIAIKINTTYLSPYIYAGQCLLKQQKFNEAQEYFNKAISIDNKNSKLFLLLGNALEGLKQFEEAHSCYEDAIALDQANLEANFKNGVVLINLRQYDWAYQIFDNLIKVNYKLGEIYKIKGIVLMEQHKYKEAIDYFNKGLKINFRDIDFLLKKGFCLIYLQDKNQAIQIFNAVIQLDPQCKEAYYNKGVCLSDLGRRVESLQCLNTLIGLDEKFPKAQLYKGLQLFVLKQFDAAVKCFEVAISQNNREAAGYHLIGMCLKKQKNYQTAITYFDEAIYQDPTYIVPCLAKGNSLRKLNELKEAILCYEKAIQRIVNPQPSIQEILLQVQSIQQKSPGKPGNQTPIAIQKKELTQQQKNELIQANFKKGLCLYTLQEYDEASKSFKAAVDIGSDFTLAINYQGLSLCRQKQIKEGLECFDKSIQINSQLPMAYFLKEYCEKQSQIDRGKIKQKIEQILQPQNQNDELQMQFLIFNETMDKYEPNNSQIFEEIFQILIKMEKFLT